MARRQPDVKVRRCHILRAKGLTISVIASRLGMPRQTVEKILSGKSHPEVCREFQGIGKVHGRGDEH